MGGYLLNSRIRVARRRGSHLQRRSSVSILQVVGARLHLCPRTRGSLHFGRSIHTDTSANSSGAPRGMGDRFGASLIIRLQVQGCRFEKRPCFSLEPKRNSQAARGRPLDGGWNMGPIEPAQGTRVISCQFPVPDVLSLGRVARATGDLEGAPFIRALFANEWEIGSSH